MSRDQPNIVVAVDTAIQAALTNVHTATPGIVQKYDAATQKADIQPNLKRVTVDNEEIQLPIITQVPILFTRTSSSFISFPLKPGDQVLLLFAERSLDDWLLSETGAIIRPGSTRKFNLADAVAIPGIYPFADTINASEDNIRIQNDNSRIDMTPDGKFAISNDAAGKELIAILKKHVEDLRDVIKVNTMLGPQPLVPTATLTVTINDLDALKGE